MKRSLLSKRLFHLILLWRVTIFCSITLLLRPSSTPMWLLPLPLSIKRSAIHATRLIRPRASSEKIPTSRGLTATNAHVGITMFALVPVATLSRTPATSVLKHYNYADFNIINYAYFNILMTYNYIVLMFFVITTLSLIFWWLIIILCW